MIEGECPKCGAHYFGWALRFPRNQTCTKCGTGLHIVEDGKTILQGYSPFTAEEHVIDQSARPSRTKSRGNSEEKK